MPVLVTAAIGAAALLLANRLFGIRTAIGTALLFAAVLAARCV